MDTQVLIVGAGPTGLMLANQLVRYGIRPLIIDRHVGAAEQSRAMAVHARTLEIYAKLGIAAQAIELGVRGTGANMWAGGKRRARVPVGDIGKDLSPYPYVLMLGQDDNEHILGQRLRQSGIVIQWKTELIALTQKPDRVVVVLKQPDGTTREIAAAWVAGCDGVRSVVREGNGIGFPGAPYEHVFFVADTVVTGAMVPDEVNVYLRRGGFNLFFPMRGPDHWRVIGILPDDLRGRDDLTFDEVIPGVRDEAGANLSFRECHWFSTYRIHHRSAERFRDRRCFVLGDAAHVHSPMGGQGMNTGLQDAYNLAWKLAYVVNGHTDAALLDSYPAEREPVATALLQTTDRAFGIIVSSHWLIGIVRTRVAWRVLAFAMRFEKIQRFVFRILSQTGIRYRRSPLSVADSALPERAPRPGDRFPWLKLKFRSGGPVEDVYERLDDTRFNLLVSGQSPPADASFDFGDLLQTHTVLDDAANAKELGRVGITGAAFYLLRPDGHVGLAGTRLDAGAVRRYLAERIRVRGRMH